ncbi:S-methyl-5'-thioinosine phosphorylase [Thiohalocapsa marina]|uniref:Probable S-methyl-5'-thioinosine phosphorylase n=1 Tax=Thiohalocapsa marina TaxID=424902 RepID=A0A5M8FQS7_9GAMM|nr:S-methyl-5'-thioinosine phosphorylase [Thiohalocapsa marina]KAA6186246.1 S-methyl-5'-thioinosine phosphorylase [Thiohalocapsa marina]
MGRLAIIGGSGFASMPELEIIEEQHAQTPWGAPSAPLMKGRLGGAEVLFLPRHGQGHSLPPHRVNYRANIQALHDAGADLIVGLGAVGGITPSYGPLTICVPQHIIDYTHGREASFHGDSGTEVVHVDFSWPYDAGLRQALLQAAGATSISVVDGGTYAVTQGPRLETAAEIRRLERDGCDIVGMTAMPEAVLARELGIRYATLAFVVNWAAGKSDSEIGMDEIVANIAHCGEDVMRLLATVAASPPAIS